MNEAKKDEAPPGPRLVWTDGAVRIVKDERSRLAIETRGKDALGGDRWEAFGRSDSFGLFGSDAGTVPGRIAAALDREILTHRAVGDAYEALKEAASAIERDLLAERERAATLYRAASEMRAVVEAAVRCRDGGGDPEVTRALAAAVRAYEAGPGLPSFELLKAPRENSGSARLEPNEPSPPAEGQRARFRRLVERIMKLEDWAPASGVDVLESASPRAVRFVALAKEAWTFLLGDAPDLEDDGEEDPS